MGAPSGTRTNVSVFLRKWGWQSLRPLDYLPGSWGPGACVLDRSGQAGEQKVFSMALKLLQSLKTNEAQIFYFLLGMQFFHTQLILEQGGGQGY